MGDGWNWLKFFGNYGVQHKESTAINFVVRRILKRERF
jgi:hypothetical protein